MLLDLRSCDVSNASILTIPETDLFTCGLVLLSMSRRNLPRNRRYVSIDSVGHEGRVRRVEVDLITAHRSVRGQADKPRSGSRHVGKAPSACLGSAELTADTSP